MLQTTFGLMKARVVVPLLEEGTMISQYLKIQMEFETLREQKKVQGAVGVVSSKRRVCRIKIS
jgi:hypothetical protein